MPEPIPEPTRPPGLDERMAAQRSLLDAYGPVRREVAPGLRDVIILVAIVILGMALVVLIAFIEGTGPDSMRNLLVGSAYLIVGTTVAALFAGMHKRIEIREHGVVEWRFGRRARLIRYEDCAAVRVSVVRRSVNFIPVGTRISMSLVDVRGVRIGFGCPYRRQASGLDANGHVVEQEDPTMLLALQVSEIVVARWIERFRQGESVRWCKSLELSAEGVRLLGWRRRGEKIPYSDLQAIHQRAGYATIVFGRERPVTIGVETGSENYWPGHMLLESAAGSPPP